jgi:hypothetical protein
MKEKYKQRHWEEAQQWAKLPGKPEQVALELVEGWNEGNGIMYGYRFVQYPESEEFLGRLATLIDHARKDKQPQLVANDELDSLCAACHQGNC